MTALCLRVSLCWQACAKACVAYHGRRTKPSLTWALTVSPPSYVGTQKLRAFLHYNLSFLAGHVTMETVMTKPRHTYWHCPNLEEGRRETVSGLVDYLMYQEETMIRQHWFSFLREYSPPQLLPGPHLRSSHLPSASLVLNRLD